MVKPWVGTGRRNERLSTQERFWQKVVKSDGCWEWQGSLDKRGYGRFHVSRERHRVWAHRFAWELTNGPIPIEDTYHGVCVLHKCDNPACVNPSHLFLGSQSDNNRDRHLKGRSRNLEPGSRHPKAKLSDLQVRQMREMYGRGWSQQDLAEAYGVSRGNVSKIVNRKSYREVGA